MKYQETKISLLIVSVILGGSIQAATAQEADDESTTSGLTEREQKREAAEMEELTVVGTRGSLQRASQIKRTADSLIDVITMEDIGAMPDEDVAAVIERMPNVTNNTFNGEGFQTLIRGLSADLTLTTYNGRELAGTQNGRELATGNLPSGILHRVSVIKSTTADLIEGGMAGTIELASMKPLSLGERILSVDAKALYNDMPSNGYLGNTGYQTGLAYFDQLKGNTLGIAASLTYSDRPRINYETRARAHPGIMVRNRNDPDNGFGDINSDGLVDFIQTEMHQMSEATGKEQIGAGFAVQWRPDNSPWEINFDSLYTENNLITDRNWDRFRRRGNATGYTVTGSDDAAVGSGFTNAGDEIGGALVTSYDAQNAELFKQVFHFNTDDTTQAYGLNIARSFGGDWNVALDLAHSSADKTNRNNFIAMRQRRVSYSIDMLEAFPIPVDITDTATGDVIDPGNPVFTPGFNGGLQPFLYGDGTTYLEDDLDSARLDFDKPLEWGAFSRVSFGLRSVDRTKRTWEDGGIARSNPFCSPDDVGCDSVAVATEAALAGAANPHNDVLTGAGGYQSFDINVQSLRGPLQESEWNNGDRQENATRGYQIDEEYLAGYVRFDFESNIGNAFVWGNIGLRYVDTQTISTNVTDTFSVTTAPDGTILEVVVDPIDLDNVNRVAYVSEYSNLLPSFNLVIEPRDDFQIRLAAGQSMSRPQFSQLGDTLEIDAYDPLSGNPPPTTVTGESGNPFLEAYTATQGEISFEWYPNNDTALTLGYFYKSVDGFVQNDTYLTSAPDQNGVPVPVLVTGLGNSENADDTFSGWELGYQQAFTFLPGFLQHTGMNMNYSVLDSSIENALTYVYTDRLGTTPGDAASCQEEGNTDAGVICTEYFTDPSNFSDYSANATLYYNDEKLNIRLSYRKKGDQVRTNRGGFGYESGYAQYDLSSSYRVTKDLRLKFEVTNLSNIDNRRYWQDPWGSASKANLQHHNIYGRRFNIGAIYKFH